MDDAVAPIQRPLTRSGATPVRHRAHAGDLLTSSSLSQGDIMTRDDEGVAVAGEDNFP
jgi:hypothetical protein